MIINSSRAKAFLPCKKRCFNHFHRKLEGPHSMNLTDGGAFHLGAAVGMASGDWTRAKVEAREKFDLDVKNSNLAEEDLVLLGEHWKVVEKCVDVYEEAYKNESWHVIQPECSFDVALPYTEHNCIWLHHRERRDTPYGEERWGEPNPTAILEHRILPYHTNPDPDCPCWTPHRVVGKTDALVVWNNNIWLHEHKTTAIEGEGFWAQWMLDNQPTIYMYGIWKSTGVKPSGFILNALVKPSESMIRGYNERRKYGPPKGVADYIHYTREPFLRTEEDLLRQERELIDICDEWEQRIISGKWGMSNTQGICMQWNRKCDYMGMCLSHDAQSEMEALAHRRDDYVDEKRLVQIQPMKGAADAKV